MPSNFIEQWARESPQEAIDFYFGHCVGENALEIFHNGLPQLLSGVKTSMSTDDYATWLGQTMWQEAQGDEPDTTLISNLFYSELSNPDLLRSALTRIEDPAIRSNLVQEALKSSIGSSYNPDGLIGLRSSLTLIDDPVERLAQSEAGFRDATERLGRTDIPQIVDQYEQLVVNLRKELSRLGYTDEELVNIRSPRAD